MSDKYNNADPVTLDNEAMDYALKYQWPGNIRQLHNLVESLTVTVPDGIVTLEKLKNALPDEKETMLSYNEDYKSFESERTVIFQWLAQLSTQYRQLRNELDALQQSPDIVPSKPIATSMPTHTPLLSLPVKYEEVDTPEFVEKVNTIDDMEKEAILSSLKRHAGARRKVAEELGIPERTLYRKIKEYGLEDVK